MTNAAQGITTYLVTHALGRASSLTADADAVCERVNSITASNGDSLSRQAVEDELNVALSAIATRLEDSLDNVKRIFQISIEPSVSAAED